MAPLFFLVSRTGDVSIPVNLYPRQAVKHAIADLRRIFKRPVNRVNFQCVLIFRECPLAVSNGQDRQTSVAVAP